MNPKTARCLCLALFLAGCAYHDEVPTERMQVKRMRVNGVALAYVEQGRGETVLFTHGAAGDWRTWDAVRPYVITRYHYVSMSRRYHYPNAGPRSGDGYSFDQHVEDLAGFIKALNVGKVHLVGSSYSGRLAGYLALRHPELLRSVVLEEPGLVAPDSPEGKAAIADFRKDLAKVDAAVERGETTRPAILLFDAVMGDSNAFAAADPERQRRWLENARTVPLMFRGADPEPVTCEELRTLKVPALVIGGELSRANFRLGNDRLLTCLPEGTERAVIPNAPHFYAAVNPQATAEAILAFVVKH